MQQEASERPHGVPDPPYFGLAPYPPEGEGLLAGVGCYRLEGPGSQLFASVEGDYFSTLGLPLLPLLAELRRQGVIAT